MNRRDRSKPGPAEVYERYFVPGNFARWAPCQQGMQFFPDREKAASEMRRVQAPGGRAAISVWRGLEEQPVYSALCEAEARHFETSVDTVAGPAFSLADAGELHALLEGAGYRRVEITPVTHTVRFPDPGRFVMLTVLAAAAVVPALSEMDDAERSALVEAVGRDIAGTLQYVEGDSVAFPMHAHIALAHI